MRKKIFLLIVLLAKFSLFSQNVVIADTNFLKFLKTEYTSCVVDNETINCGCQAIKEDKSLDISNLNIKNINEIQYFTSLNTLNCSKNQLYNLTQLPTSIQYLDCSQNNLIELPNTLDSLIELNCSYNKITSLPLLPSKLVKLSVSFNLLSDLPNLPSSITYLDCGFNSLLALPNLPSELEVLYCDVNFLKNLPNLPVSLIDLFADLNCYDSVPDLSNLTRINNYTLEPNRIDCKTDGIGDKFLAKSDLLYPNPAINNSIQIADHAKNNIEIYNSSGQKILNIEPKIHNEIDLSKFISGIYYFKSGNEKGTFEVIK